MGRLAAGAGMLIASCLDQGQTADYVSVPLLLESVLDSIRIDG